MNLLFIFALFLCIQLSLSALQIAGVTKRSKAYVGVPSTELGVNVANADYPVESGDSWHGIVYYSSKFYALTKFGAQYAIISWNTATPCNRTTEMSNLGTNVVAFTITPNGYFVWGDVTAGAIKSRLVSGGGTSSTPLSDITDVNIDMWSASTTNLAFVSTNNSIGHYNPGTNSYTLLASHNSSLWYTLSPFAFIPDFDNNNFYYFMVKNGETNGLYVYNLGLGNTSMVVARDYGEGGNQVGGTGGCLDSGRTNIYWGDAGYYFATNLAAANNTVQQGLGSMGAGPIAMSCFDAATVTTKTQCCNPDPNACVDPIYNGSLTYSVISLIFVLILALF